MSFVPQLAVFWLVFIAAWIILLAFVGRWERRMVWPYGALEEKRIYDAPSGYGAYREQEARQAGFEFLGWVPDLKGEKYLISYGMFVSPERDCFVIVSGGALFGIPVASTWIYSQTAEGRCLYSTDKQAAVSIDVSRSWRSQLVPDASFAALLTAHRAWIRNQAPTPFSFEAKREIAMFRAAREDHYRTLAERGIIEFTDDTEVYWRYTIMGAIQSAALNYLIGLVRAVTFGRLPRTA